MVLIEDYIVMFFKVKDILLIISAGRLRFRRVKSVKIGIIADEGTVNSFRLVGLRHAYAVKNAEEADKLIRGLLEKKEFALIIITDGIANRIRNTINEVTEEYEYPLVISVPSAIGPSTLLLDPITELIKRKIGIDLK
jgi:V/A-type H+/Na+-transporting ATPase subunit F